MRDRLAAAREWFERGDRDIEAAQLLQDEQFYADVIAYHLQQAIEKYLKGLLVLNDVHPPRTHDLDALLNLVRGRSRISTSRLSACARRRPDTTWTSAIRPVRRPSTATRRWRQTWT